MQSSNASTSVLDIDNLSVLGSSTQKNASTVLSTTINSSLNSLGSLSNKSSMSALATAPTSSKTYTVMPVGDSIMDADLDSLLNEFKSRGIPVDFVGRQSDGPSQDPQNDAIGGFQIGEFLGTRSFPGVSMDKRLVPQRKTFLPMMHKPISLTSSLCYWESTTFSGVRVML